MRILVFGDSIVYGGWDTEGGWVSRLRKFYDTTGFKDENYFMLFYQLGIDSQTTEDLLERFDAEVRPRVDENKGENIIIFEIGKNDSTFNEKQKRIKVEKKRFEKNIKTLFSKASKLSSNVIFIGLARTFDEKNPRYKIWTPDITFSNSNIREYDTVVRKICKRTGAGYIDLGAEVRRNLKSGIFDKDGVHLNNKGHEMIFRLVKAYLERKGLLKAGTPL